MMNEKQITSPLKRNLDTTFYALCLLAGISSVLFVLGIIASIFGNGIQAFAQIGLFKALFGTGWYPTHEPPEYGFLPLILGSFFITFLTILIAVPLGIGTALFISEVAKPWFKEIIKPVIELLASIPSVIFGLFGMVILGPFVRNLFNLKYEQNAFVASFILGIMVIPIIASISEDAINAVPRTLREASYGLGANKWETITRVVLPAAKSGVITSIILGIGRAIGETMVVLMVAGGSAVIPTSIFSSVRPMPSSIAAEMGETAHGDLHRQALFAIAVVLFVMTLLLNIVSEWVRTSAKRRMKNLIKASKKAV